METTQITRETTLCISLSGRPSNLGTRFHNFLYADLGLNFIYKAFTTDDIDAAVGGIRALGIRGAGISMPFKAAVIPLIDSLDESASVIESVNTIVNTQGHLRGYNTDYSAVATLLDERAVPKDARVAVLGSGGMARACVAALRDRGNTDGVVIARNEQTGTTLAQAYGYAWANEVTDVAPEVLVNATPIGMAGGADSDALPVPAEVVRAARFVVEVVAMPPETPLSRLASESGLTVVTGTEVQALQAADQFALYTGVRPTADQVARAAAFSRS